MISLRIVGPSLPCLYPERNWSNRFPESRNRPTCALARVSFQFEQLEQRKLPTLLAVGIGSPRLVGKKGIIVNSNSRKSVFKFNAALNARCSQGQTQTVTREAPTITKVPVHGEERSPKLDDGGSGFPPRDDGGGGGGGGGGADSSGGFFLFGFLLLMGYLKDLEGERDH